LEDLIAAAAYLLRWGGRFVLTYRPDRLVDLFCALRGAGLEPKRLRLCQHKADAGPFSALVEARRGGRPGLIVPAPLVLCRPDGSDTAEVRKIYGRSGRERKSNAGKSE
jgi:tRNA1(Val) A37 N6-methylase TrmN6